MEPKRSQWGRTEFSWGEVEHLNKILALNCLLLPTAKLLWFVVANVLKLAVWILVSEACHFLTIIHVILKIQGDAGLTAHKI